MHGKSFRAVLAVACCAFGAFTFQAEAVQQDEREIGNIAGDVYFARDFDGHLAVFMVTAEGIFLGDSITEDFSAWLEGELDRRFSVPVRYIFYSHHHFDHATGASDFADTARVIGQENMIPWLELPPAATPLPEDGRAMDSNRNGRVERSEAQGNIANQFDLYDADGDATISGPEMTRGPFAKVVIPEVTFSDKTTIRTGGKRVELISVPIDHADDLTIAHFPQDSVLFVSDFVNVTRLPFVEFSAAIDKIRMIESLDFDYFSPGHGSVGTRTDFVDHRRYREDLRSAVAAGIAAGQSLPELRESVLMEEYSDWELYDQWRIPNVNGMYDYLQGAR
jgi:glyoxylase-like metal-dependent hydrolase (beta-lactamase superfamily II)